MVNKTNLLNLGHSELEKFCISLGEKSFRSKQILKWIYSRGVTNFDLMTDLGKTLRKKLSKYSIIKFPKVFSFHQSSDGTRKWLLEIDGGDLIETVFIPEKNRGTLCISTQAGCNVSCLFCSTGKQGFSRNLNLSEIISQVWIAESNLRLDNKALKVPIDGSYITNVVFMGMGEPLLNYSNTKKTLELLLSDYSYGLSKRKVTISTSGIVPFIDKLAKDNPVSLAVSLHASNDNLRDKLVPINKKYPLKELINSCIRYLDHAPRRNITFEYCLIDNINDSKSHAKELVALIKDIPCKLNIIPFNSFKDSVLNSPSKLKQKIFSEIITESGKIVTIRKTRGTDIDAACGQLAGKIDDITNLLHKNEARKKYVILRNEK